MSLRWILSRISLEEPRLSFYENWSRKTIQTTWTIDIQNNEIASLLMPSNFLMMNYISKRKLIQTAKKNEFTFIGKYLNTYFSISDRTINVKPQ